jgi:hypothetical protein
VHAADDIKPKFAGTIKKVIRPFEKRFRGDGQPDIRRMAA